MSWTYEQSTGKFFSPDGSLQASGYSGQPPHANDPQSQNIHNAGPIPQGEWEAVELIPESAHGPYAIRLEPKADTTTFGRSGFLIHGERIQPPTGLASNGCIIMPHVIRELFWNSADHDVLVVSGE